jgi:hypothetical protein
VSANEERAALIADRVRADVFSMLIAGDQATETEAPEIGEIITIERRAAR